MKQQCQELQARVLQEDGIGTAVQHILEQAKLARVPQANAALLRRPPWQTDKAVETADGLHPDYAAQVNLLALLHFSDPPSCVGRRRSRSIASLPVDFA